MLSPLSHISPTPFRTLAEYGVIARHSAQDARRGDPEVLTPAWGLLGSPRWNFKIFVERFIVVIVMAVLLLFHKSYAQDLSVPINIEGNNIYIMARINGIPIR